MTSADFLLPGSETLLQTKLLTTYIVYTFRLAFSKDPTVSTTAGATVRHLVSAVYDRAISVKEPAAETYKEHTQKYIFTQKSQTHTLVEPSSSYICDSFAFIEKRISRKTGFLRF